MEKRERAAYFREYRRKVRKKIKEYKLAKGCKNCGYNKCSSALGFHHKEENKEYQIARGMGTRCWETILKEIKKCDVMCANCHTEYHYS